MAAALLRHAACQLPLPGFAASPHRCVCWPTASARLAGQHQRVQSPRGSELAPAEGMLPAPTQRQTPVLAVMTQPITCGAGSISRPNLAFSRRLRQPRLYSCHGRPPGRMRHVWFPASRAQLHLALEWAVGVAALPAVCAWPR